MSKRSALVVAACILVGILGLSYYLLQRSPTRQAQAAAHQFWVAVVAGDRDGVSALLSSQADFTAGAVIDQTRGLCYGGPCGGDRPNGHVQWVQGPTETGAEVLVLSVLRDQTGTPYGRSLAMKRVNGQWRVTRQGASFSY